METVELSEYEQERGKPMPSLHHSIIQSNLVIALNKRYQKEYSLATELSLQIAGRGYVPDICIYPKLILNWRADIIRMTEMPLTAIEIASPTQGMQEFTEKMAIYFAAGIKSFWLILPMNESLTVFLPEGKPLVFSAGDVTDSATGVSVSLSEIFS